MLSHTLSLFPSDSPSFASFWRLLVFSPSFQTPLFLSLSVGIFFFLLPLKASVFFNCLPSAPFFLPFLLSVIALCCFLSPCHQLLRKSSDLCLSVKVQMKSVLNQVQIVKGCVKRTSDCACVYTTKMGKMQDRYRRCQTVYPGHNFSLSSCLSLLRVASPQIWWFRGKELLVSFTFWKHYMGGIVWCLIGFRTSSSVYLHSYPLSPHPWLQVHDSQQIYG